MESGFGYSQAEYTYWRLTGHEGLKDLELGHGNVASLIFDLLGYVLGMLPALAWEGESAKKKAGSSLCEIEA
jgi:hypothetical protein